MFSIQSGHRIGYFDLEGCIPWRSEENTNILTATSSLDHKQKVKRKIPLGIYIYVGIRLVKKYNHIYIRLKP